MEPVLIREPGDTPYVRVGREGGTLAYVHPANWAPGTAIAMIGVWDAPARGGPMSVPSGFVYVDRDGWPVERCLSPAISPYWGEMAWFGWLLDMAVEVGLELAADQATSTTPEAVHSSRSVG